MAEPKFRKYFTQMFEQNRDQFLEFMLINQEYAANKAKIRPTFNEKGLKIKDIVHSWEDRLCGHMEKGQNSAYSAKLGEKFQHEVTKYFPYFHEIGLK